MLEWIGKAAGSMFGGWRRRRVRQAEELRGIAFELRSFLNDLIAVGGFGSSDFSTTDAKTREARLEDIVPRLGDRQLKQASEELVVAYRIAWASSPAGRERVEVAEERLPIYTGHRDNPEIAKMLDRQITAAHDALDAIRRILERLNRLERWVGS